MQEWLKSVYSDTTRHYVSNPYPQKGERVTIRLRMLENQDIKEILIRTREFGIENLTKMELVEKKNGLDYYAAEMTIHDKVFRYQFYLVTAKQIYYYTQYRITDYIPSESQDFIILADYKAADWVGDTVFYQIFPDRFYNGCPRLNVRDGEYTYQGHMATEVKQWNTPAARYEEGFGLDFYNGDIAGIIKKLDYLEELGINGIYLNPIFVSPSVHKYDSLDYYHIDPHLGGDKALARLSAELHRRNMRLMMDISINHTSSAAKWFNKENEFYSPQIGAYGHKESPLRNYYFLDENNNYDKWCGVETMPKLNYTSDSLRNTIYRNKKSVLKKWMTEPYDIDAWRFDVADCLARNNEADVHRKVLEEIRDHLKGVKKDIYLLAEDWADCADDLQGMAWDGTMNYFGCARPIREFAGECDLFHARDEILRGIRIKFTAKQLSERILQFYGKLPGVIQHQMFNLLDSHDVSRLYNNPKVIYEEYCGAVIMMFTLPGTPSVYYGDEILLDGDISFGEGCRYPMDWEWEQKEKACKNRQFYRKLIKLKREAAALRDGGFQVLSAQGFVFSYARFTDDEIIFVVCSTDSKEQEVLLPVKNFGMESMTEKQDYFGKELRYVQESGQVRLVVPAHESYLISCNRYT